VVVGVGGATWGTAQGANQRHSGLWLIALGGWLLVNTLGLWGFWWSNSWPLVIMAVGVVQLVEPKLGEDRWSGLWPLAIGLWCLVNTREIGGLSWAHSWPLLLVLLGALLVARSLGGRKATPIAAPPPPPPPDPGPTVEAAAEQADALFEEGGGHGR
jgi:hypothetical protein